MKKLILFFLTVTVSNIVFASNLTVEKAIASMQEKDVRTITKEVENKDENPCLPEGKSFQVELQIKSVVKFDYKKMKIIYFWKTVKTINVDKNGHIMEICIE